MYANYMLHAARVRLVRKTTKHIAHFIGTLSLTYGVGMSDSPTLIYFQLLSEFEAVKF